jgi:transcriptional regulator with XRE-family HTH domain
MNLPLKVAMLRLGVQQTRMAVALGWDPAKLSRIVHEVVTPSDEERKVIAKYLGASEDELFLKRSDLSAPRIVAGGRTLNG